MPRITLKPNSPEFHDETIRETEPRLCDAQHCVHEGLYKAPKGRESTDHFYFCFDHVKAYNESWDYFSGMSDSEIATHMARSLHGDRPTWRYGVQSDFFRRFEEQIRRTHGHFDQKKHGADSRSSAGSEDTGRDKGRSKDGFVQKERGAAYEAMTVMGLSPPLSLEQIKSRYRELVKTHHPDAKGGDKDSEELLKSINMAYTVLKLAYAQYETLPERT